MVNEDDDPVVKEIPVYHSKALMKELFLLQYTMKPFDKPVDYSTIISAKVKIKQQKLEMEQALDTNCTHYDECKGEMYALNVDGKCPNPEDATFKSDKMDVHLVTAAQALPQVSNYAVGAIKDGELHLTSLAGILQARPNLSFLDKCEAEYNKVGPSGVAEEHSEDEEGEAKQVTVKYARRETDRAKKIRENSYAFLDKRLSEETWKPLKIHPHKSHMCSKEQSKLICASTDLDTTNYWSENPEDYLKLLLPPSVETDISSPNSPDSANSKFSKPQLRSMPIKDQIKFMLINSKVIRMDQLIRNLPREVEINEVIKVLQQVAWLVQGCWVVKSEIIYANIESSANGTPHDVLCRGRDFILWRFTQRRDIVRKEIFPIVKLPYDDIKDILLQMSRLRTNKSWEFKYPFDTEFVEKFPDVLAQQKMKWDVMYTSISKYFALSPTKDKSKVGKLGANRQRRRTKSGHSTSGDESSGTDASKKHHVKQLFPEQISPIRTNISNNSFSNDEESKTNDMSTVRFVPTSQTKAELLKFVQSEIDLHWFLTVPMLRKHLEHMLAESPPGNVLITGVSDMLLFQALIECGGEQRHFKWLPSNESLFFFWKPNEPQHKTRKAIVDLFEESVKVRIMTSKKKVEEIVGLEISEAEFRSILKDYATPKSGYHYFKMDS